VAHVIDHVLIPPCAPERPGRLSNAVELAGAAGLSELVNAAVAAGLGGTLSSDGPYTIFAPSNAAFEAAGLVNPTVEELVNILTFHVVEGRILSSDLAATQTVTTLQGGSLTVTKSGSAVSVSGGLTSDASVILANQQSCNAVVHVIDKVLVPEPLKK
jgi:transforming growth factor-beta-induced protein